MSPNNVPVNKVPANWNADQIPSQKGKVVIVTGANVGIGYVTALELARHGADVVLACRNDTKCAAAAKEIREAIASVPTAGVVTPMMLDVSSLASVESFSTEFAKTHDHLDVLVNNAGVMAIPYETTVDGLEMQFATNHLGHFALTSRLFPLLKNSSAARVINVSSALHRGAKMDKSSVMMSEGDYSSVRAYNNSKLYNLLFSIELDRRLKASGITSIASACAHPGLTRTNLISAPSTKHGFFRRFLWKIFSWLPLFQDADMGALPQLYAATGANVSGGDFFGPEFIRKGFPVVEEPGNDSKSEEAATALWEQSERLAQLKFHVE